MGNRHGHKQLRIAARERMAQTGESYQQARSRILEQREARSRSQPAPQATPIEADLLPICFFGSPAALALFTIAGRVSALVVSLPQRRAPFPLNPLRGMGSDRTVH